MAGVWDLNRPLGRQLLSEYSEFASKLEFRELNVSDEAALNQAMDAVVKKYGHLNLIIISTDTPE